MKIIRLFDKSAFNKNNSSRLAFNKNNNSKLVFRRNNSDNKVKFDDNNIKHAKNLRKSKSQKLKKLSKNRNSSYFNATKAKLSFLTPNKKTAFN